MDLKWRFSGGLLFSLTFHALLISALVYTYPEIENRGQRIWKEYPLFLTKKTPASVSSFENTDKGLDIISADKMNFPDLVLIRKQKTGWVFISQELLDRRMELQPKINDLTSEVVNVVADSGNYIDIIGIRLNKVERLNRRLDQLDKFFVVVDKIAEKEKGGRVFIRKDPEKKEEYELRFEQSVEAYETHLEDLNLLLSD